MTSKLKYGDKIGIISPSHAAEKERYQKMFSGIRSIGFDIVEGKNLYKDTYGYRASEIERADDFNDMVSDNEIKMVFFGGGYGSNEIVPYLDYEKVNTQNNLQLQRRNNDIEYNICKNRPYRILWTNTGYIC